MQIEGRNPVLEVLRSDQKVNILFIQSNLKHTDKIRQIISAANQKGVRIKKIGKNQINKKSRTKNHQGVIAKATRNYATLKEILEEISDQNLVPFFVIINEVLYQQNLGAIIRSAECAGCSGVIISKKTRLAEEAVRASMGATEHIPLIRENLFNSIRTLRQEGIPIVALEDSHRSKSLYNQNLAGPIAFIIGGEDSGVTKSILSKADIVLKIPIFGKINSLNMSNATAVALFEKVRQEINFSKN